MQYGARSALDGAEVLGCMLLAGAAMGIFYDIFRILRRFFHFGYSAVFIQDIMFFIVSAIGVFFAGISFSEGNMRVSYVLAVLAGWFLYSLTLGAVVMFIVDKTLVIIRKAANKIWSALDSAILGIKKIDRIT